jgi:hypothetical protein
MLHERHSSFAPEPLLTPFRREKIHRTGLASCLSSNLVPMERQGRSLSQGVPGDLNRHYVPSVERFDRLEQDPEKWNPVFRKDYAQPKS